MLPWGHLLVPIHLKYRLHSPGLHITTGQNKKQVGIGVNVYRCEITFPPLSCLPLGQVTYNLSSLSRRKEKCSYHSCDKYYKGIVKCPNNESI